MILVPHYIAWLTMARAAVISEIACLQLQRGGSLLDLGSMEGDLPAVLHAAFPAINKITCVEGRRAHITVGRFKYPEFSWVHQDLAKPWYMGTHDFVLCCGIFYHLPINAVEFVIENAALAASHVLVIDTEVVDAHDGYALFQDLPRKDAALGIRSVGIPSAAAVDRTLAAAGWKSCCRVDLTRPDLAESLDSVDMGVRYTWQDGDPAAAGRPYTPGQRRLWIGVRP